MPNSRIVMMWRRVSDRTASKSLVKTGKLGWREVGSDAYSTIYDAGNVLVGLWEQDFDVLKQVNDACSALNLRKWDAVINPASDLLIAPRKLGPTVLASARALRLVQPSPAVARSGYSFFDNDGNLMSFYKAPAASGRLGMKLTSLTSVRAMRARTTALVGVPAPPAESQVLGFRLMVSDVARSTAFYQNVLGFKSLGKLGADVAHDAGPIIALRPESHGGLMNMLRARQRLLNDWYVIMVDDIEAEVARLKKSKVGFPQGIESSGIGDMAYFTDPDGHSFALWKPSGKTASAHPIDFYPNLQRITAQ
jgi:predicted enzyme related to lactoylglutathione lyase